MRPQGFDAKRRAAQSARRPPGAEAIRDLESEHRGVAFAFVQGNSAVHLEALQQRLYDKEAPMHARKFAFSPRYNAPAKMLSVNTHPTPTGIVARPMNASFNV